MKKNKNKWSESDYSKDEIEMLDKLQLSRKSYRRYLKMYEKKEKHLSERYDHVMFEPKFSFRQWKENYATMFLDTKKEIVAGVRKNVGDINQYLVSKAAFDMSDLQAHKLKEAFEKSKIDLKAQIEEQKKLANKAISRESFDAIIAKKNELEALYNVKEPSLTEIRLGKFDWSHIKNTYHDLRAGETLDSYEAKNLIGWYFFGS